MDLPTQLIDLHGTALYRCHSHKIYPSEYNMRPADTRYAAPNAEFGVLYLAFDVQTAFIETFGSDILEAKYRVVAKSKLDAKCICRFAPEPLATQLNLVDLTIGSALTKLNLDNRITTLKDREVTKLWSKAFWQHPQRPDGILYWSCNEPSRLSVVLYDRVGPVLHRTCGDGNYLASGPSRQWLLNMYHIQELDSPALDGTY